MKQVSKKLIFTIGFSIIFLLIIITVKLPHKIKSPCRFVPQTEWLLTQVEPDKFSAKLVLNDSNKVKKFTLLQFNREDFLQFSLLPGIHQGKEVSKGEIIGQLVSFDNHRQLANLTGELMKAKANWKILNSGEKFSIQKEAIQSLEFAKEELKLFEPQIERSRKLLEQNLISQQEWEIADAQYTLLKLKVLLKEARAEVTKTGGKTETLQVAEAEIYRLENQIAVFEEKISFETIRSPIDGVVTDPAQQNILCQITKMDTMIAQIPIPSRQRKYLKVGQIVSIHNFENKIFLTGTINTIGNNARLINNSPMFIATCLIDNKSKTLLPGMIGFSKIYSEKTSILERLKRTLIIYFNTRFLKQ
ncbi:HlyD family efflux transporter periplasmic adaptor subunit [candidate division KSB1 bacterium]|nr:HlyD family efflux transporter periplasmic adaptor subunit [candidate division KSB1 bacterium]